MPRQRTDAGRQALNSRRLRASRRDGTNYAENHPVPLSRTLNTILSKYDQQLNNSHSRTNVAVLAMRAKGYRKMAEEIDLGVGTVIRPAAS